MCQGWGTCGPCARGEERAARVPGVGNLKIFFEMALLSAFITKAVLSSLLYVSLEYMFWFLLSTIDLFSGDFIDFTNY